MSLFGFPLALAQHAPRTFLARCRRGPLRPTWSFAFENLIATLRSLHRQKMELPPPQLRAFWDDMAPPSGVFAKVERRRVEVCGIPGEWITPRKGSSGTLLYLHGGGYMYGSAKSYGELVARLSLVTGMRALLLEYRLAPEHPFPAALDDALAAYRSLLKAGTPPEDIVVAGDSAGGGLTAALTCALRDAGDPLPAGCVLICPWVDLLVQDDSMRDNSRVDWLEASDCPKLASMYLGGASAEDPRASPIRGNLAGLPPMLIQVGSAEIVRDQGRAFAERARAAGVEAHFELWPDMIHDWHLFASVFSAAREAIQRIGEFARQRVEGARLEVARRTAASRGGGVAVR